MIFKNLWNLLLSDLYLRRSKYHKKKRDIHSGNMYYYLHKSEKALEKSNYWGQKWKKKYTNLK